VAPIDTAPDRRLLLALVRSPERIASLSPPELSLALDAAAEARLLGWLVSRLEVSNREAAEPEWLRDRLVDGRAMVAEYDRAVRWEIDRIARAFSGLDLRWVLLKGAAYLAAGLAPGRGRRVADVDVLVPQDRLNEAEGALRAHGWEFGELDAYDERYYREWMHELPPMIHEERRSVVDLHHAILPRTSRINPESSRLLEQAVGVSGGVRVLSPAHMVLHAAAHLFHDGEIAGAIRDVVDLDGLFNQFGREPTFWSSFVREATELNLERPAYYAVRYVGQVLNTSVPAEVIARLATSAPTAPVRLLMDALVRRTVTGATGWASSPAALALYVRSHWLRMPTPLLLPHLARKAFRGRV
jgi:hypothetical protein